MNKGNLFSFFLGVATIGLLGRGVFAATTSYLKTDGTPDFQKLKSTSNNNQLNSQMRNDLMDGLSKLQTQQNSIIPAWAVMAFNLASCPAGWTRFTDADGRFIMGYPTNSKEKGGNATIKLTIKQLPPHSFKIAKDTYKGWDDANTRTFVKSYFAWVSDSETFSTNTLGEGQSIDIQNPYIKLLYCQKN